MSQLYENQKIKKAALENMWTVRHATGKLKTGRFVYSFLFHYFTLDPRIGFQGKPEVTYILFLSILNRCLQLLHTIYLHKLRVPILDNPYSKCN